MSLFFHCALMSHIHRHMNDTHIDLPVLVDFRYHLSYKVHNIDIIVIHTRISKKQTIYFKSFIDNYEVLIKLPIHFFSCSLNVFMFVILVYNPHFLILFKLNLISTRICDAQVEQMDIKMSHYFS